MIDDVTLGKYQLYTSVFILNLERHDEGGSKTGGRRGRQGRRAQDLQDGVYDKGGFKALTS